MDRAHECVDAGGWCRDGIGFFCDVREDLALEEFLAARRTLVDRDVVRRAGVLVVEVDLDWLVRCCGERRLFVGNVLGGHRDRRACLAARATAGCSAAVGSATRLTARCRWWR